MKTGTLLTIVLLGLVACAHLLRLVLGWQVTIEGAVVPMWVSVFGVLVPGGLALLLWQESRQA